MKSTHWQVVWYIEKDGERRRHWHVCWTFEQAVEYRAKRHESGDPTARIERRIAGRWAPVDETTGEPLQPVDLKEVHAFIATRDRVLARDNWRCQHCGGPSVTVDYLPGRRPAPGDTVRPDLDGLASICGDCRHTPAPYKPGARRAA